jgi:TetR/AcrR family transcriptional regulator, fatty acid metabolism regulator protein
MVGETKTKKRTTAKIKQKALNKRDHIMATALDVFAEKSFHKTTINEVASAAGVSVGSVYDYFKDKDDLAFAIANEFIKNFADQMDLHLVAIDGALNKLRKYIWFYIYYIEQNPKHSRVVFLDLRGSKAFFESKSYDGFKVGVAKLLEIIEEGQQEGVIISDVDKYLARQFVMGIVENMTTRWLLKEQAYSISSRSDEVTQLIYNGLVKK